MPESSCTEGSDALVSRDVRDNWYGRSPMEDWYRRSPMEVRRARRPSDVYHSLDRIQHLTEEVLAQTPENMRETLRAAVREGRPLSAEEAERLRAAPDAQAMRTALSVLGEELSRLFRTIYDGLSPAFAHLGEQIQEALAYVTRQDLNVQREQALTGVQALFGMSEAIERSRQFDAWLHIYAPAAPPPSVSVFTWDLANPAPPPSVATEPGIVGHYYGGLWHITEFALPGLSGAQAQRQAERHERRESDLARAMRAPDAARALQDAWRRVTRSLEAEPQHHEREEADERAKDLARAVFPQYLVKRLERDHFALLELRSGVVRGRSYRLSAARRSTMVYEHGRRVATLCVQPDDITEFDAQGRLSRVTHSATLPMADWLVCQYLHFAADECAWLESANILESVSKGWSRLPESSQGNVNTSPVPRIPQRRNRTGQAPEVPGGAQ